MTSSSAIAALRHEPLALGGRLHLVHLARIDRRAEARPADRALPGALVAGSPRGELLTHERQAERLERDAARDALHNHRFNYECSPACRRVH